MYINHKFRDGFTLGEIEYWNMKKPRDEKVEKLGAEEEPKNAIENAVNATVPYNNLPPLPPATEIETIPVLKKVTKARAALAEMKGMGATIPNQAMLINGLTLREAKDSSAIENIITTQDELYIAFATQRKDIDPQIKEVLNYREALWHGYKLIMEKEMITTNYLCEIQKIIIANNAGIRAQPGTVLKNTVTEEIIYTPPTGEDVIRKMLQQLETFINADDDMDPLIKMALIHYQFESNHPFYDGNGRTGRILNILYLVLKGLLDTPLLYLSSYIIKKKQDYYNLLSKVRYKENWEEWINFILTGVEETAKETALLINNIKALLDKTIKDIKEQAPEVYSKEMVEILFEHPYCKASFIVDKGLYERRTAMKYLKVLEQKGFLRSMKRGKQVLFINIALYDLLKQ